MVLFFTVFLPTLEFLVPLLLGFLPTCLTGINLWCVSCSSIYVPKAQFLAHSIYSLKHSYAFNSLSSWSVRPPIRGRRSAIHEIPGQWLRRPSSCLLLSLHLHWRGATYYRNLLCANYHLKAVQLQWPPLRKTKTLFWRFRSKLLKTARTVDSVKRSPPVQERQKITR